MNGFGGMDGIKTGYTRASGFNLVSSVQRDGKYVVGSVFGGASAGVRNAHMRVVLFRALGNAST
jgi:D-alanyl-D-alanine carboxypeptidase